MKTELNSLRKISNLNESSEQILCVREHSGSQICITLSIEFDYKHSVSQMLFKIYKLDISGNMSQICIGKSPCAINENGFVIIDIGIEELYRDKGFGSVLLSEIINYSKYFDVAKVIGKISYMDVKEPDAKDRLFHFYKKHGFVVDENIMTLYYFPQGK